MTHAPRSCCFAPVQFAVPGAMTRGTCPDLSPFAVVAASTNPGNLKLLLADLLEPQSDIPSFELENASAPPEDVPAGTEPELEVG